MLSDSELMLLLDEDSIETFRMMIWNQPILSISLIPGPISAAWKRSKSSTGLKDAIRNATGTMNGQPVIVSSMEYSFIGGSMGAVVGEAITRAIERACKDRKPIIVVSASGGARMMEGVVSLMQMAKISAALARLDTARVPYISVLTDPTTGGVTGFLRDAGRPQYCGTRRADRFCRAARD